MEYFIGSTLWENGRAAELGRIKALTGQAYPLLPSCCMNLLLLHPDDFIDGSRARIGGRRLEHLRQVHRAEAGAVVRAGLLNGATGTAQLLSLKEHAELLFTPDGQSPAPLPLTLVLALPRPKMLRRILQGATAQGVKRLYLVNSYKVEKSFWQTPFLQPEAVREQLVLGLEQAVDTVLPQVELRTRFKPFVEDELPAIAAGTRALMAHPGDHPPCPVALKQPCTLAIGPEGGWIPYEVELMRQAAGFEAVSLGARILRVETAVTALLARLYP